MIIEDIVLPPATKPPNIHALANEYKQSEWFSKLSAKTRLQYDRYLEALVRSSYGDMHIEYITPRLAKELYRQIKKQSGVRAGQYFVAVWNRVYSYALKNEYITHNPWIKLEVEDPIPRASKWTEEQVFSVIEKALEMDMWPLAAAVCLLYDTCQRPGDVLQLCYHHIHKDSYGYYVDLIQSKRKKRVRPTLSKYTIGLLDLENKLNSPEGTLIIPKTRSLNDLRYDFKEVKKVLGLPKELQLRDLRRTAITEMGAASDDQMVAVSGHSDRNMLNIYSVKDRIKAYEAQQIRYATRNSRLNTEFRCTERNEEEVRLPGVRGEEDPQCQ